VHEIEPKASLWNRLFLPLTRKIPLQATAVVVIAVLAVFLYQKEQSLNQNDSVKLAVKSAPLASPSGREAAVTQSSSAMLPATLDLQEKSNSNVRSALGSAKPAADELSPKKSTATSLPRQQIQPAAPLASKAEIEARLEDKSEAPRKPPIQVQEVSNSREPGRLSGDMVGFGNVMPLGGLRQATPRPVPVPVDRALSQLGERTADFEFVVRRRSSQRRDSAEAANVDSLQRPSEADAATSLAARRAAPPSPASPKIESIAEIRFYNVAPEHYEFFKKELAAEANIESESKAAGKERDPAAPVDRQLLIKVTILPPDSLAPSR
jgi:hypothetical protein